MKRSEFVPKQIAIRRHSETSDHGVEFFVVVEKRPSSIGVITANPHYFLKGFLEREFFFGKEELRILSDTELHLSNDILCQIQNRSKVLRLRPSILVKSAYQRRVECLVLQKPAPFGRTFGVVLAVKKWNYNVINNTYSVEYKLIQTYRLLI